MRALGWENGRAPALRAALISTLQQRTDDDERVFATMIALRFRRTVDPALNDTSVPADYTSRVDVAPVGTDPLMVADLQAARRESRLDTRYEVLPARVSLPVPLGVWKRVAARPLLLELATEAGKALLGFDAAVEFGVRDPVRSVTRAAYPLLGAQQVAALIDGVNATTGVWARRNARLLETPELNAAMLMACDIDNVPCKYVADAHRDKLHRRRVGVDESRVIRWDSLDELPPAGAALDSSPTCSLSVEFESVIDLSTNEPATIVVVVAHQSAAKVLKSVEVDGTTVSYAPAAVRATGADWAPTKTLKFTCDASAVVASLQSDKDPGKITFNVPTAIARTVVDLLRGTLPRMEGAPFHLLVMVADNMRPLRTVLPDAVVDEFRDHVYGAWMYKLFDGGLENDSWFWAHLGVTLTMRTNPRTSAYDYVVGMRSAASNQAYVSRLTHGKYITSTSFARMMRSLYAWYGRWVAT